MDGALPSAACFCLCMISLLCWTSQQKCSKYVVAVPLNLFYSDSAFSCFLVSSFNCSFLNQDTLWESLLQPPFHKQELGKFTFFFKISHFSFLLPGVSQFGILLVARDLLSFFIVSVSDIVQTLTTIPPWYDVPAYPGGLGLEGVLGLSPDALQVEAIWWSWRLIAYCTFCALSSAMAK